MKMKGLKEDFESNKKKEEDYIFRYKLEPAKEAKPFYQEPLLEMVRTQLESLLNIIIPTEKGREVKIDGFKLLRDKGSIYKIFCNKEKDGRLSENGHPFQPIKSATLYEPRIELIKKQLESLLTIVDLEKAGEVLKPDSFRLKSLTDWISPSICDPIDIIEHLASRCNCDCIFCYNKGTPPSSALANVKKPEEEEFAEIKARIKYFFSKANLSLFPNTGNFYEPLLHPQILEVLRMLREKIQKPLKISTNGCSLTPQFITELPQLQPIYLYLALNSSSPSRRQKLMRDKNPEIAINALPLLQEKGIPYAVTIVPWPIDSTDEMLSDLSSTVVYADKYKAHLIQINLPGYSKFLSPQPSFNTDEVWMAIVSQVRELRAKIETHIVVMPSMYEENLSESRKNLPRVIGLIQNSPAYFSELKRGDIILKINELPIQNRPQARDLLSIFQGRESGEVFFELQRGSQTLKIKVNLEEFSYPYSPRMDSYLGIVFLGQGFRLSYLDKLKRVIDSYRAKRVLFLSSRLVKPFFEQSLAESQFFGGVYIDIGIPSNNFFGGNIFMGDLLVVQDFIDFIKDYLCKAERAPDLIIIPSTPFSLGGWKRDLTGRVYLDIEREVGIPVELLECDPIFD